MRNISFYTLIKQKRTKKDVFYSIYLCCRLKVDAEHIKVEEDKLKIIWHAAGIEKWLLGIFTSNTYDKLNNRPVVY